MYKETSFDEWYAEVKSEYAKNGLTLPEDIELMELAHMECMNDGTSIEEFVQQSIKEQKGNVYISFNWRSETPVFT